MHSPGNALATDKWDTLLSEGRRLWGFASDDYHKPSDAGRAWLMAYVKERSIEGVLAALRGGRFYASTGVDIAAIAVDDRHIRVETRNAQRIAAIGDYGRVLALADGSGQCACAGQPASAVRRAVGAAGRCVPRIAADGADDERGECRARPAVGVAGRRRRRERSRRRRRSCRHGSRSSRRRSSSGGGR